MRYPLVSIILATFPTRQPVQASGDDLETYYTPALRLDEEDDEALVFTVTYRKNNVNLSQTFDQDLAGLSEEDQSQAIDDFKYAEEKRIAQVLTKKLEGKLKQGFSKVSVDVTIWYDEPASPASLADCKIDHDITLTIKVPVPQLEETLKREVASI